MIGVVRRRTQHNRRALRPLIDLRNKMRRQIVGRKWWKKLMKFRKKQFFRMRFHDIEKARSRRPTSVPSHHASSPEEVGGFFFDFEAVRTDLTEMLRAGHR